MDLLKMKLLGALVGLSRASEEKELLKSSADAMLLGLAMACGDPEPSNENAASQWPVQIKLVPIRAPFFNGCSLLIAADCTGYAYPNFHKDFMSGHVTLIGCPKLDSVNYTEKLTEIFRQNDIREILLTRMTVPCCGGMSMAVKQAIANCGKEIPLKIVTIDTDGTIANMEM